MRIYLASSWRNPHYEKALEALRAAGHEVYDFKNPRPGEHGFHWSDVLGQDWVRSTTPASFRDGLRHPISQQGFASDMKALERCEAVVLALPSGRSAHIEAGYAIGRGKASAIFMPELPEPELMYLMAGPICLTIDELVEWARQTELDLIPF